MNEDRRLRINGRENLKCQNGEVTWTLYIG